MTTASPAEGHGRRVSWPTLLAFGLPSSGYAFYLFFVQFYFLKYATDVLLIAPAVAGALIGAGRLWDAVSDPRAGYWSDRTRTRLGRRRPWLLAGIPLLAVSSLMVLSLLTAVLASLVWFLLASLVARIENREAEALLAA